MMKKLLFLAAFGLAIFPALAQHLTIAKGVETKSLDAEEVAQALYVGAVESYDCWIMDAKRDKKQVVVTDGNLEIVQKILLEKSNDAELLTVALDGRNLFVVTVDGESKNKTVLWAYRIQLLQDLYGKMTVEKRNPDTLQVFNYDRKDRCQVWGAASPDRHLLATVVKVENVKQKQYSTQVKLYNALSKELWSKEVPLPSMDDIYLTNDGRVVTFGNSTDIKSRSKVEETTLEFGVVGENRQDLYGVKVKFDPLRDLRIANVLGNRVIAVGTYSPQGRDMEKGYTGGTVSMSFDFDSATLTGFSLRGFQNEDMCILYNKNTKKVVREHDVDHVELLAMAPTPYGAVMVVGRTLVAETFDDANNPIIKHVAMGLHVEGVDMNGRQVWVRNLRRNDWTKDADSPLCIELLPMENGVCLLKSEHMKCPSDYNITDEAKELEMGSSSNLVAYTFAADGEVGKQILEGKEKQTLLRVLSRADGMAIVLMGKGSKIRPDYLRVNSEK